MTAPAGVLVVDSSAVVALLADAGELGEWAAGEVAGRRLAAPSLLPFEVGNSLRRVASPAVAAAAHGDLLEMHVDLWPHDRLAERAWELRGAVSYYDAAYVALAELLDAPLVTLDRRLARAPGPRCAFRCPPAPS